MQAILHEIQGAMLSGDDLVPFASTCDVVGYLCFVLHVFKEQHTASLAGFPRVPVLYEYGGPSYPARTSPNV